jgi:predicted RNase H-like HicB family nuclease
MYPQYRKQIFQYVNQDRSLTWIVEFPDLQGCTAVGKSEAEALKNAQAASELWLDEHYKNHQAYPAARELNHTFSGRLVLRLPKTLHKQLTQQAEDEGVSLNTLIVTLISLNFSKQIEKPINNWVQNSGQDKTTAESRYQDQFQDTSE